jgi:hypothetical protein
VFEVDIETCEQCGGAVKVAVPAHLTFRDGGNAKGLEVIRLVKGPLLELTRRIGEKPQSADPADR